MTNTSDPIPGATSFVEALLRDEEVPGETPARAAIVTAAADLSTRLAAKIPEQQPETPGADRSALLAAYLDGGLDEREAVRLTAVLAESPASLHDAISAVAFLDALAAEHSEAPSGLLDAAIAGSAKSERDGGQTAAVVPFPKRQVALSESFLLLAAASRTGDEAILCRSQSGLWTLEVFVGQSEEDRASERGSLLLTVHPDHQATYNGRTARIFVKRGNEEHVLAKETVRDGEVYAEISLSGLDLKGRDAVSVVFGPAPDAD